MVGMFDCVCGSMDFVCELRAEQALFQIHL